MRSKSFFAIYSLSDKGLGICSASRLTCNGDLCMSFASKPLADGQPRWADVSACAEQFRLARVCPVRSFTEHDLRGKVGIDVESLERGACARAGAQRSASPSLVVAIKNR
jgi:hypothetical protein